MKAFDLPYQPIRRTLYTPEELFDGYDPEDPASWAETPDFAIYRHFVKNGREATPDPYLGMMQALHDHAITQATEAFLVDRKAAAIMGGHRIPRGSRPYLEAARLARRLTRDGVLVCTGGGPGVMEASHLGAALAGESESALGEALDHLASHPVVPAIGAIVSPTGEVDREQAAEAHAWFQPAYEVAEKISAPAESLAVPTWHYGHEPSTPFATHIAKYFQNSVREAGLTALATQGIIFTAGRAGTLQEIFQDSAQNFYRTQGHFSPMVLLGEAYWTEEFPVVPVLEALFSPEDFQKYVLITDRVEEAATFIEEFQP